MNLNKRISSIFLALLFLFSTILIPSANADYDSDGIADYDDFDDDGDADSDDYRVIAEFGWDMSNTDGYSENAGGRIRTCEPVRTGT